ncbi:Na+/H+ antiporter NhaC family protein [Lachnoanaerobaculum sp. Marseille-Q4761]|uniref:Na+/H+ antiporter NhaC family protein n=1 Tax=Lachnoanaerobaculum sp. Marseille-Q4761 TaxID=2819511 RepID=UPI001AA13BEE|nr:Na+/H+ antiporter NhaC family protein [Lachnoanaerobaculum sp. Marseille-Q4761]MBO1871280.1 Na+/H+ antiporter NhaC family protein [Lachnoanaerobaculum sp. Marseille-Q4761]
MNSGNGTYNSGFFRNKKSYLLCIAILIVVLCPMIVYGAEAEAPKPALYATFWSLVPPLVAIVLALISKEVYSSLAIGLIFGGMLASGFNFEGTMKAIFEKGFVSVLSSAYNVGILIFLVILGMVVALMNKTGGSDAFGKWASKRIKTRVGAQLMSVLLGCLIFIDDYFNCLTVGSVMRPVTDKHQVSRAKLAYLIDATAAPVCIISPISSWAAAVTGFVDGEDGFALFIKAIPFNYYALLTIVMMIVITVWKFDFGPMKLHEENAKKGDLFTTGEEKFDELDRGSHKDGKLIDMLFPIISLIICCVIGMLYTGGIFSGAGIIEAFSNCDASVGLSMGSFVSLIITLIFYIVRRSLKFTECMDCLPAGFKAMVPAILILTFAWSLKSITDVLGAKEFVATMMEHSASGMQLLLPAIIFVVAVCLAFSTGTSWGTFGILIPIVVAVFAGKDSQMMIISISACMAGAVCGDHCSPISDTTIMASAGAQSNHINHVNTQLPYAMLVAAVSFVSYIIAAFIKNAVLSLIIAVVLMIAVLFIIKTVTSKEGSAEAA